MTQYSYSMKKTALKNTEYSKNETILNIGKNDLHAKAIAFAKSSVLLKKENGQKHSKDESTDTIELFYAKKSL